MKHYLDTAEHAARQAGKLLRENFRRQQRVNAAAAHDLKLEIDVQAQELITNLLLKEFPGHAIYGEEGIAGDQSTEHQWVVDPLDGTVNYFYGIPHFCVSIALRLRSEIMVGVIYDPMRDEMWAGQKGEKPKLNGQPFHVSDRAELAEAVISIGLAKTGETINANFPLLQALIRHSSFTIHHLRHDSLRHRLRHSSFRGGTKTGFGRHRDPVLARAGRTFRC